MRKGSLDIFLYSSDLHQPAGLDSIGPRVYKAPDHATTGKTLPKTLDDYTRLPSIDDCKRPASADQIESLSDRREGVIPSLFNFNGTETNGRKVIRRGYYWRAGHRIQRLGCGEIRFSSNPILHDSNLIPRLKLRRFTDEHVRQTIDTYISGRTSLRRLPRCGPDNRTISLKTAYRWVVAAALNCKSPLEVSVELRPEWGRFLELDATPIRLRGELYSLMVALDMKTQDILHAKLLSDERDPRPIRAFLKETRDELGYQPHMIIIDDNPSLKKAVREIYPFVPLQLCALHKQWTIDRILPDKKIDDKQCELKYRIKDFLFSNTLEKATEDYRFIIHNVSKWPGDRNGRAIESIRLDQKYLLTHHNVDKNLGLLGDNKAPRTISVIEGFFSRLSMKRNQIRGFKSSRNLPGLINLIIMNYRATKFQGARDSRSPLERAKKRVNDWIQFSQSPQEKQ